MLVAVVAEGDRVLLFLRPDDSELLAGTWELPWVEVEKEEKGDAAGALAARYGGRWRLGPRLAEVRHGITFRDLEVAVHRAEVAAGGPMRDGMREGREAGWFDAAARAGLPLSSLVGKVLKKVLSSPVSPSVPVSAAPPARRSPSRRRG